MPIDYNNVIDRRKIGETELSDAHISADEMKKIMKDTMSRIKDSMATKNFLRWMKERGIRKDLRKMVVRVCNDKNDKYFENNSVVAGYAALQVNAENISGSLIKGYNVDGEKSVTLKERSEESKGYSVDTATHEFLHIISSSGKMRLATFLDEGLTQYITELIKGEIAQNNGYRYNVAVAR